MILVTGGTGLVGSHLIKTIVQAGERVRAIKRKGSPHADLPGLREFSDRIEWVNGDILDIFSLEDALQDVKEVYHAAAIVSFRKADQAKMWKTNVEGTANIVNACLTKKVRKICHVSSVAAIGRNDGHEMISEESRWENGNANTFYAKTKYASEKEVWRGISEGLNAVIVNPSIILGPGRWNGGSPALFSTIYNGLAIYPAGVNAFVDVRDVAEIMIQLMRSDITAERFLLISENLSYKMVFEQMAKSMGVHAPFRRISPSMAEIAWRLDWLRSKLTGKSRIVTRETARTSAASHFYTSEKIKRALSYTFIPIKQSISDTADVFLKENASMNGIKLGS